MGMRRPSNWLLRNATETDGSTGWPKNSPRGLGTIMVLFTCNCCSWV